MKVLLGMSGGVDSSAAAIILKNKGFEVIGITFKFYKEEEPFVNNEFMNKNSNDVTELCKDLKIDHKFVDVAKLFEENVVNYFVNEYIQGKTPFPCVVCNVKIKWAKLFEMANKFGCDYIASGHYVSCIQNNNKYYITKGKDKDKDQSFFLWGLNQQILKKAIFPLAEFRHQEVREIVKKYNPLFLNKKQTSGICFLKEANYRSFLKKFMAVNNMPVEQGDFIDEDGKILGKHEGYPFYTIGQRRGLNLNSGVSYYVKSIFPERNEVVLGSKQSLFQNQIIVKNYHIVDENDFNDEVIVKIRYRKQATPANVTFISAHELLVDLLEPLDAIAPGQTAVFYKNDKVLGGGFILK